MVSEPRILRRSEHRVSRSDIDTDALKVLYRLHRNGHAAYLVGGGVRDLLLGRTPKDFDIGTSATPEEILDLFRNSRVIGRRFPIVHILFGRGKAIEVSTFRSLEDEDENGALPSDVDSLEEEATLEAEANALIVDEEDDSEDDEDDDDDGDEDDGEDDPVDDRDRGDDEDEASGFRAAGEGDGERPSGGERGRDRRDRGRGGRRGRRQERGRHLLEFSEGIQYGTPAEDAMRRDLTINGLFYDIGDFSVIDFVGGLEDLDNEVIRGIGDPDLRFQADPVRIIRALRHSARTGFRIEPATWEACCKHAGRLVECSKARVLEEFYRDLRGGAAAPSLELMKRSGVLEVLLPELDRFLPPRRIGEAVPLPWKRLEVLDRWVGDGEEFGPAFLLALLFTFPLLDRLDEVEASAPTSRPDIGHMAYRFLKPLTTRLGVARRDTERLFLIAISQRRLDRTRDGHAVPAFFANKSYFDEAWRLFQLDTMARGEELPTLEFGGPERKRRSRRRRRRRRRD